MCNPNLLINPDFKINQRGQTEYTESGHSIDGWNIDAHSGAAVLSAQGDFIRFKQTEAGDFTQSVYQVLEYPERYSGKAVALSIKHRGPNISQMLISVNDSVIPESLTVFQASQDWLITKCMLVVPAEAKSIRVHLYADTSGSLGYTDYKLAKLELGEFSTLANEIVDHAAELRKCQRYLQRILYFGRLPYRNDGSSRNNYINESVIFNPEMRVNPSLIENYSMASYYANDWKDCLSLLRPNADKRKVQLVGDFSSLGTASTGAFQCDLLFSAEL